MGGKLRPTWHWPLVTGLRSPREKGRAYFLNHSWEIDLRKSFVLYNLQLCLQQKVAMQLFDTKKTWQLFLRGLQNIRTWWRQKGPASYYMIGRSDILHDLRYSTFWSRNICVIFATSCKKMRIVDFASNNVSEIILNTLKSATGVLSQHNGGGRD